MTLIAMLASHLAGAPDALGTQALPPAARRSLAPALAASALDGAAGDSSSTASRPSRHRTSLAAAGAEAASSGGTGVTPGGGALGGSGAGLGGAGVAAHNDAQEVKDKMARCDHMMQVLVGPGPSDASRNKKHLLENSISANINAVVRGSKEITGAAQKAVSSLDGVGDLVEKMVDKVAIAREKLAAITTGPPALPAPASATTKAASASMFLLAPDLGAPRPLRFCGASSRARQLLAGQRLPIAAWRLAAGRSQRAACGAPFL